MAREFIKLKNSKDEIYYRIILNDLVFGQIAKDAQDFECPWTWLINVDGSIIFIEHCESLKEAKSQLTKEIALIEKQYSDD